MPQTQKDTRAVGGRDNALASLAGKYMTFKLGGEEYGLELLKVRELIGLLPVTRIPGTRDFIRGVINLRGKVIPVVDLRLKFSLPVVEKNELAVIIVVQFTSRDDEEVTMGMLVDEVVEVLNILADQIEPLPAFGTGNIDTDFILGVGKADKRVICLLDIGRVLSGEELGEIRRAGLKG